MARGLARIALVLLLLGSCSVENPAQQPATLDRAFFVCNVQPVLVKQCATPVCHGTEQRYFRLYARNRLRSPDIDRHDIADPLTEREITANYDAARALVGGLDSYDEGMFVKKPLEERAGGYYHGATKKFLRSNDNVFASEDDPEYAVLLDWVHGKIEDPSCVDPGAAP